MNKEFYRMNKPVDSKYVQVFDNVITKEFCEYLINKFHENKDRWEVHENDLFTFNQINLVNNMDLYEEEVNNLMEKFQHMVEQYAYHANIADIQFPREYGFEAIRMKHYPADKGVFKPHIDANDVESMRRFLVFFLYLDEGEGGETALYDQGINIPRKPGRLLMFPPTWTFPHAGNMPIGNDKHIIGSYLHYVK